MKIECVKEKLAKALMKAEKMTSKQSTLPVLSCVLLKASNGVLSISSTNLDLGLELSLPVKVLEEGAVAVPGSILSSFIGSIFNDKNVVLETEGTTLKVSTEHTKTFIKTLPMEDFPNIPKLTDSVSFTLPIQDFVKGLKSVSYASSQSTIKPTLASVYIYPDEDFIVFVATDSFRLAEKKIKVKKHKDFSSILLPFKNIPEIIKTFEDISDEVTISFNQNQISFEYEGIYLVSRVIDGSFPDYKNIIPKETKTEVVILKQDMVNSLKISNIFTDKFSQVYVNASQKDKLFEVKTKNLDIGENTNTLDAVVRGDDITMSFNHKYINDCFQSIESDSLTLSFVDQTKPMVIKGSSDSSYLYLVMPMNK
ncbi:MAG: DNA polymerase III subunit beta [Candidatus Zambryskibacteria bacterium]|nr:DNA polymerase III subunit beta [Candidatus Zambryskibacteria bacterium]